MYAMKSWSAHVYMMYLVQQKTTGTPCGRARFEFRETMQEQNALIGHKTPKFKVTAKWASG